MNYRVQRIRSTDTVCISEMSTGVIEYVTAQVWDDAQVWADASRGQSIREATLFLRQEHNLLLRPAAFAMLAARERLT